VSTSVNGCPTYASICRIAKGNRSVVVLTEIALDQPQTVPSKQMVARSNRVARSNGLPHQKASAHTYRAEAFWPFFDTHTAKLARLRRPPSIL